MKKLFVAVALVMGIGTSVFAYNMNPASIETVTTVNDFTPIEVKDLPAAVQEAITKNYADLTIKEASVEAKEDGTKTYKVVLTDKEGTESTVLFSESGEVLKMPKMKKGNAVKHSLFYFFSPYQNRSTNYLRAPVPLIQSVLSKQDE